MKTLILSFWVCLFTVALSAQDISIKSGTKNKVYAFGGPIVEIAVDPQAGLAVGGMGGIAVGDFSFGGFGISGHYNAVTLRKFSYEKTIAYGGIFGAYSLMSNEEAHLFTNLRLGRGVAQLNSKGNNNSDISDGIYIVNPEIGLEINVSSWSRFIISASYRWVNGIDNSTGLTNADFENYAVGMTFRFGKFGQ